MLLEHLVSAAFCPEAQLCQELSWAAVQDRLVDSNAPAAKTLHNSTHQYIPFPTVLAVFCPGQSRR